MIYLFSVKQKPSLSQVGGKGKALIETYGAGLPVPEGLVLSVDFLSPWLREIKALEEWKKLLTDVTMENCDAVKTKAAKLKLTPSMKEELEKQMIGLGKENIYAVRSSSPEEDLKGTSFAGMYETFLGVTRKTLETYIAKAFSSCFDFRVMEYKKQNDIDLRYTCIAIIVQRQIVSEVSGVGFSLNPNNNCYDEVMINAAFGLGETIVSGTVTPDTYIVDSVANKIIKKKINNKKIALYLHKNGGTIEIPNKNPEDSSLSDDQIIELTELIKKCETYYGIPIDTEWAYEKGKLHLLQSRPITTYFPLYEEYRTKPGETKHLYLDQIKLTQGFQYSLSELGNEIFAKMVVNVKAGIMPEGKDGIFYAVAGRQYIDLTNSEKAFGYKKVKKTIGSYDVPTREILNSFDFSKGYHLDKKPKGVKNTILLIAKLAYRAIPDIMKARKDPDGLMDSYFQMADTAFMDIDKITSSDKYFDDIVNETMLIFNRIMTKAMGLAGVLSAESNIRKMFHNMNVDNEIIALSIDLPGNPTSEMGYSLVNLASFDEFRNITSGTAFSKKIKKREFSDAFLSAYDEHMKKYGCRCVGEIDMAAVRPYENLEIFYNQLKLININDNAMQHSIEKKEKAIAKLKALAKKIGKEKKFNGYLNAYKLLGIREHPKYMYVYANDKLRQLVLKLAKEFVKEGRLETVDDIFMLASSHIGKAQRDKNYNMKNIINTNKKKRELTKNVKEWPTIIDSRGKIFRYIRESEEGDLVGDPVSPGVIKGKAKVLLTPFEKPLNKGEILVAKATEPTWTPIFINASAVVMEIGGPLQHGAIIAREYGIPCVTGVDGATTIIKDGDLLMVDGSSGIVKIIES
ncbi:putative phosphoenolpyruvate synthase [Vallitalea longa]|uniref:Phosphoenolpyruvate synthase n=1 Tax=Vallitalea longa TaxID=2936439 RepID=A0A9W5YBC0_9FIRM|nr:PEP/pyruvate-binding domain-containing protein [Vallitalea longa]GKX28824.1 putative phosphoenolpyruvate synthase [Vallitalea longa]